MKELIPAPLMNMNSKSQRELSVSQEAVDLLPAFIYPIPTKSADKFFLLVIINNNTESNHMIEARRPLFELGKVVGTPSALKKLEEAKLTPSDLLDRHIHGDYGDLHDEDREANENAVKDGERILSSYPIPGHVRIWVITEADRSSTTLLLPSEY